VSRKKNLETFDLVDPVVGRESITWSRTLQDNGGGVRLYPGAKTEEVRKYIVKAPINHDGQEARRSPQIRGGWPSVLTSSRKKKKPKMVPGCGKYSGVYVLSYPFREKETQSQ